MVPFYGQGMNAGMEDVRILFSILDQHGAPRDDDAEQPPSEGLCHLRRCQALADYSAVRAPDAHAINDLALQNYVEMRSSVLSRRYQVRKYLEEFITLYFPKFGWSTKYSRVSFSNEGYRDIVRKSEQQGKVLMRSFAALLSSPLAVAAAVLVYRHRRTLLGSLSPLAAV